MELDYLYIKYLEAHNVFKELLEEPLRNAIKLMFSISKFYERDYLGTGHNKHLVSANIGCKMDINLTLTLV